MVKRLWLYIVLLTLGQNGESQELQIREPVRFLALGDSYTVGQSVDTKLSWPRQLYSELGQAG